MANYIAEPQARVLADSVSPAGHRVTTMEVTMHRFVLAEFNTHRVFSRNSASSRAIPGRLQRDRVRDTPAMPSVWPSKARGMQGGADVPLEIQDACDALWSQAATSARRYAEALDKLGVHKSVSNRLLEPFLFQTVIVTSTEWDNFFEQRCSPLAQPEIRVPAELMQAAYEESTPELISDGWHTPLVQDDEDEEFWVQHGMELAGVEETYPEDALMLGQALQVKVSAARCARVSYLTHDGKRDLQADLDLYDRLVTADPPHWSPLEHVATPCIERNYTGLDDNFQPVAVQHDHKGNLTGWDQLRHLV